jgi:6-phosphogluconolactonase
MKILTILSVLIGLVLPAAAEQFLFLAAAQDSDLVSYRIEPRSGKLTEHARLQLPGVGGPMALSADGRMLYLESHIKGEGEEQAKPHIISIAIEAGEFKMLHVAPVPMRSPSIHVDASGKNLLGAHYGEGKVSVWKIDANRHCTGEVTDVRTTATHAHFVTTDPSNRFVYVPHTEPNAVFQFALDAEGGKLTPLDPPFTQGPDEDHRYHGPRHYAHHPSRAMGFTANERGGGISSWKFDEKTGQLSLLETLSSLPPGWEGGSYAADIKVTPNGRFAYVSNRDGRKLEAGNAYGDTVAAFEIDLKTGKMKLVGHYPTEHVPRSICIDLTGNFLFAAGELSDKLVAYRVHQETGALERIGTYETGKTPIWVTCYESNDVADGNAPDDF